MIRNLIKLLNRELIELEIARNQEERLVIKKKKEKLITGE